MLGFGQLVLGLRLTPKANCAADFDSRQIALSAESSGVAWHDHASFELAANLSSSSLNLPNLGVPPAHIDVCFGASLSQQRGFSWFEP